MTHDLMTFSRQLGLDTKAFITDYVAKAVGTLQTHVVALEQRVAAVRDGDPGAPGRDGRDGVDGKDADPAQTKALVTEAVTAAIAQLNLGGLVRDELAKAVARLPPAKDGRDGHDGKGITGTLIDRDGRLVLTMSDGSIQQPGIVVGQDADMARVLTHAGDLIAQLPPPRDGKDGTDGQDGLGFDDMNLVFDEKADGFLLRFTRGAAVRDVPVPLPYYKGPYVRGQFYKKGQQVSHHGVWAAMDDTYDTPGQGKTAWRLVLKDPERGSER